MNAEIANTHPIIYFTPIHFKYILNSSITAIVTIRSYSS
jgi:hypothetical protein